jgi:DNA polymerase III subunit alpha
MCDFVHLHSHTQFSLLDGAADIKKMLAKAKYDGMQAAAITDHGNMFGVFKFYKAAKDKGIKPILGCEVYVVEDRFQREFTGGRKDKRYHQLLLAKNAIGYANLSKIVSTGYLDGLYRDFPRVDREVIRKYKEGLIATTCCVGAEVPQTLIHKGEEAAEKVFLDWLDMFGDDYYIELQRHEIDDLDNTGWSQEQINQVLLKWAAKYNVTVIATNDSHYIDQKDAFAHDILLCLQTGKDLTDSDRFKFPSDRFYFKTQEEMKTLFRDVPFAIENTMGIAEKVEHLTLEKDILLPHFALPEGFQSQDDYLKHLAYAGARKKYGEVTQLLSERIDFELNVIRDMGFPGYFLIVQDFIDAAKKLGVSVGPGRGSAAGSAVAYCIGITNIDPIKYDLLFERFLNPQRVSMPDMDIDFDDEGRQKVINYVIDKYGKNQVAQIITYGTMAARSALRDVGRVMKVPIHEVDTICKMFPENPKATLEGILAPGGIDDKLKEDLSNEHFSKAEDFRKLYDTADEKVRSMITEATVLEGSVRHRGIHAAGVIIAPSDIREFIPVCTAKDSDLLVTQFDGKVIESAGMLKMDFLGLKTLTIIQNAIDIIKKTRGTDVDPDEVPLDDPKTWELYQKGDTVGTFQFESDGMRMHLKDLKPNTMEDLIAMNALYRPGPMSFIPTFIKRKHGKEKVEYPHPLLGDLLKPTYGIMVYQEQIMQAAQVMAGYSLGDADLLRRAMGKKKPEEMALQKEIFVSGAAKKGIEESKAVEVFEIMEKFANYGFNRSHAAAYSVVAYQTAYLKANFPAEYMAAVLSNNMSDIKQVNLFLKETRRMGIVALGPDINESNVKFTVNYKGEIRFALSAIKGVGEKAVESIVQEREANGPYTSVFDFSARVGGSAVNRKNLESLAQAGALDCFEGTHRAQYFAIMPKEDISAIDKALRWGQLYRNAKQNSSASLFGGFDALELTEPELPRVKPWDESERLAKEKEITGFYISGHPLDEFEFEIVTFTQATFSKLDEFKNKPFTLAAMVTNVQKRISSRGKPFAIVTLEDYEDTFELQLFDENYNRFINFFEPGNKLFIAGKYEPAYKDDTRFRLNVSDVMHLVDLMGKKTKAVQVSLWADFLDEELSGQLEHMFKKNKGKVKCTLELADKEMGTLGFSVRRYGLEPTSQLIQQLNELQGVQAKIVPN